MPDSTSTVSWWYERQKSSISRKESRMDATSSCAIITVNPKTSPILSLFFLRKPLDHLL